MDLKTKTVTSVQQIQVQLKNSFMHDTGSMTALKRLPSIYHHQNGNSINA